MRYKTKDMREMDMIEIGDRFEFRNTIYEATSKYHDGGISVTAIAGNGPAVMRIAAKATERVIILN